MIGFKVKDGRTGVMFKTSCSATVCLFLQKITTDFVYSILPECVRRQQSFHRLRLNNNRGRVYVGEALECHFMSSDSCFPFHRGIIKWQLLQYNTSKPISAWPRLTHRLMNPIKVMKRRSGSPSGITDDFWMRPHFVLREEDSTLSAESPKQIQPQAAFLWHSSLACYGNTGVPGSVISTRMGRRALSVKFPAPPFAFTPKNGLEVQHSTEGSARSVGTRTLNRSSSDVNRPRCDDKLLFFFQHCCETWLKSETYLRVFALKRQVLFVSVQSVTIKTFYNDMLASSVSEKQSFTEGNRLLIVNKNVCS